MHEDTTYERPSELAPRRRTHFVVQPRYQIQFAVLLVIFQFNVGIVYQGILQMRVRELAENAGSLRNFLDLNLWAQTLPAMLAVSAVGSVLVYLLGLYFSNSIVGPIPRLRRVLRQLADGHYSQRVQFRPGDVLEDLAQEVNHLAASLEHRRSEAERDAHARGEFGVEPASEEIEPSPI